MMPGGRPTKYTRELGLIICQRMCDGESLKAICKDDTIPDRATIHRWLVDGEHEEFHDSYAIAYNIRTENMFDELIEIADDGTNDYMERQNKDGTTYEAVNSEHINRSRLRVDTRKWKLAKMHPEKYSDRIKQEHSGTMDVNPAASFLEALRQSREDKDKNKKDDILKKRKK